MFNGNIKLSSAEELSDLSKIEKTEPSKRNTNESNDNELSRDYDVVGREELKYYKAKSLKASRIVIKLD